MSPNSYSLRRAAGFDSGGQVARVVRAEARLAQRAQQILQRLEAQEIDALVGDLDLHASLALAPAAALLRLGVDVAFVDQLLHQAARAADRAPRSDMLFELLADLLGALRIEHLTAFESLLDARASDLRACAELNSLNCM